MKIIKKNIRNAKQYLERLEELNIKIASPKLTQKTKTLLGLEKLLEGIKFLPLPVGPVTEFNANGKYIPLKNEPKEYRVVGEREWHWKDWGGTWHSKMIDIKRLCYKRKFLPPPSHELTYFNERLYSEEIKTSDCQKATFIINLFLEIFGECELVDSELTPIIKTETKNWQILPPGEHPFAIIEDRIRSSGRGPDFIKATINRLGFYKTKNPLKIVMGSLGFAGYLMYYFNKYIILDSMNYGDAVYIFKPQQEDLCTLSKKEILDENLHSDRIIHASGWESKVIKYAS